MSVSVGGLPGDRATERPSQLATLGSSRARDPDVADQATLAAVLDEAFVAGLDALPFAELRERRARCESVEAALSFRRRLLHGHLDLLRAEVQRRDVDGGDGPVTGLLDSLRPEGPGPASTRSPSHQRFDPGAELLDLEEADPVSADLPDLDDDALRARGEELVAMERRLSEQRRDVLARLDAIQDEIVRRYRDGEASIDQILPSGS